MAAPEPPRRGPVARALTQLTPLALEGLDQLRGYWREHLLTLLGIVWGSAAVILLLSIGAGFNDFLDIGLDKTGDRWIQLDDGFATSRSQGLRPGRAVHFLDEDLEKLRAGLRGARAVAGETQWQLEVETPRAIRATVVSGGTPELQGIQRHELARGRFYDRDDFVKGRRVVVLGASTARHLFGDEDPIGRTVQIESIPFRTIGVLRPKGFQLFIYREIHDEMAFVPLSAGRRLLGLSDGVDHVYIEPARRDEEGAVRAGVREVLGPAKKLTDADTEALVMFSVPEVTRPISNILFALRVVLGFIGTIALGMAAVGVANLMTAVVNERRREFAMRRACGARRGDVTLQLLVETVVVIVSGGLCGAALGAGLVVIVGALPLPSTVPQPTISGSVLLTTFLVLVAVGIGAGIVPSRLASAVDPAAALRVN